MAHAFNPSISRGRDRQISEFKASLVYESSRIANIQCCAEKPCLERKKEKRIDSQKLQRNPVSKNPKKVKIKKNRFIEMKASRT